MSDTNESIDSQDSSQEIPVACTLCSAESEVLVKCENCQSMVCANCADYSATIHSHEKGKGEYQVCSVCSSYIAKLESFLRAEEIKWCILTPRGQKWFEVSGAKAWASNQMPVSAYHNVSINPEDQETIDKDVNTGRSNPETYNWEIREILLRVIRDSYKQDITRVLSAYCVKNNKVGYCQGMNIVTVWLLMFMDHDTAFFMLCYLIERWLLPDFYIGGKHGNSLNGFYIESTVIAGLLEYIMPIFRLNKIATNEFSDFFSLQHLIQMFVSTVDIETTVFLWDMLCQDGSIALIRGIASLVVISEKAVGQGVHPLHILKLLNENRVAPQVKEVYFKLQSEINSIRVEKLRKLARDYRAKQWLKCEKLVLNKLEHVSNFSKEEIQKLQEQFNILMKSRKASKSIKGVVGGNLRRRQTVDLPQSLQKQMEDYHGSNTVGITKEEFMTLLSRVVPDQASRASTLFDKFDEDGSGYLDFRELTIAMSVISKGDFEDKLRICFDAYDSDHSGYLQMVELQLLIESMLRPYSEAIENDPLSRELKDAIVNIHTKMMQLSEKFNGKIAFCDFLNGIKADMLLYNCMSEYIGMERHEATRILNAINTGSFVEEERNGQHCNMCTLF